ncbi:hypothetical protein BOTBODRAFT_370491 [Botryobasidium botryosum FD-172 SS1]|uniref:RNase III domain-containing protein n=1 Tax=Botryobasidium botryosum (strain FD-172 SS1) TaxID=930990 RepID=A0A067MFQ3_BOTB1|nr:hypothetical protein BOTBODRAFT_370491 [Botryobasidium botryosum FD-172 SS1]
MRLPQFNRWSDFGDGLLGNPIAIMPTPAADFIKAKLSGATLSRPDIIQQVFRAFADTERIVPLQACEGLGKRLIDYLCTRYIFNRYGEIDHKTVAHIRVSALATGILQWTLRSLALLHSTQKLTKNLKTLAYAATSAEFHNYFPHGDIHPLEDYFGDIESTRKEEEDRAARQGREQGPFWVGITRTEKRLAGAVAAAHGALIISENFNPEHAERLFAATIKPLLDKYVTRDTVFFQPLIHLAVTLRGKDWEIVTVTDKTKNDVPSSWKSDLFIDGKTCVDSSEGTRNKALIACAIKAVSILKPTPAPPQSVLKDPQSDTAM